jgi:hypothetical protein
LGVSAVRVIVLLAGRYGQTDDASSVVDEEAQALASTGTKTIASEPHCRKQHAPRWRYRSRLGALQEGTLALAYSIFGTRLWVPLITV